MGQIFVLSGPSSVGKTTFLQSLTRSTTPSEIRIIPRYTERPKRPGESDDFEYHFLSHRAFLQKVYAHDFVHVERWGNYYTGIDRNFLEDEIESGHSSIVLASTFAAARLRATYKTSIAHLYMWTGDKNSLMDPRCMDIKSPELQELIFRIKKKNAEKGFSAEEIDSMVADIFVEKRMVDNFVDIAAVNGRLRNREDIYVLSNYHDRVDDAVRQFKSIRETVAPPSRKLPLGGTAGCFVLMPFDPNLSPVYEDHIVPVCTSLGISVLRADKIFSTKPIIEDVQESVSAAKIIIADLTNDNPNVFYEVGICHALGKQVILITQNPNIPFDVRHLRCIIYSFTPRGMKEFEQKLRGTLEGILD